MKLRTTLASVAALTLSTGAALAEYPERTINMVIPFSAGGGTDVPGRFFAAEMEKLLGQNIVATNVEGAGGTIGATQQADAPADGYNLLFAPVGTMTTQPHLRNTSYNVDSWTPICMVSEGPYYLVVGADSGIESVEDYKAITANGGPRFVGAGPGSMDHVAQLTLDSELGIEQQYLPTGGGADKATEIGGGRADASVWFADFDTRFNFNALAIMADERSDQHPDIPTMQELGYDVNVSIWFGLFAQDDAPAEAVETLSAACETAVSTDSFKENMAGANRLIRYMGTDEFGDFFRRTFELNGELMRKAGLVN
ncbi:Bug family tripartite tricarboxylate transporter substrate binding protein [Pseudooctadecabacter jejudonensis]|uniref:Tripartite tricarboxylate transporter family receptor n=1 Tax=Pseudooctadecabacter jejudonensis TaxID=1391910 RepID=A0A1Y5RB90_9RHOB|nr:tripartite tricarboxylate transporter substrate binding protein [Pseudooctadecabacter jejudonensis]SLN13046.1 Tripartite tricarboxylate transporter family receptor [Pseudooctadecabacter jejudonensis]